MHVTRKMAAGKQEPPHILPVVVDHGIETVRNGGNVLGTIFCYALAVFIFFMVVYTLAVVAN